MGMRMELGNKLFGKVEVVPKVDSKLQYLLTQAKNPNYLISKKYNLRKKQTPLTPNTVLLLTLQAITQPST